MIKKIYTFFIILIFLLPILAFAQSDVTTNPFTGSSPTLNVNTGSSLAQNTTSGSSGYSTLGALIGGIQGIVNSLVPLILCIAVILFLWGLVKFVTSAGDEDKRTEGRNQMIWGIIVLFVMVSVWGLVNILVNTVFNGDIPSFPGSQSGLSGSGTIDTSSIAGIFNSLTNLLQSAVVPFIFALALVYFLIGVLKYINAGESEEKAKEGRNVMIYGIIALFVMVSVFGIVQILTNTFGFGFLVPQLPGKSSSLISPVLSLLS